MSDMDIRKVSRQGIARTIPDTEGAVTVGTSNGTVEVSSFDSIDLRGRWVYLVATGGDITIRMGSTDAVLYESFTIFKNTMEEVYIPDDLGDFTLNHIASAASSKLSASYDSQV